MFNFGLSQSNMYKSSSADGGRYYNDMDNMDLMNYDNEFMTSDFFDTIKSVEDDMRQDLMSPIDDPTGSSDTSSHTDGFTSPRNDISETEASSTFTDDSGSPLHNIDVDEALLEILNSKPVQQPNVIEAIQAQQVEFEQATPIKIVNYTKPKKIIIENSNVKVVKPIYNATQMKKIGNKKILKLQSWPVNGKPVILPYGLKSIKILNPSDLKTETIQVTGPVNSVCRRKIESNRSSREESQPTVPHTTATERTEVKLTDEERRLLEKEGVKIPKFYPLDKNADRELKRVRRKIRNKLSAQDSRKRKKEYVDGLEERVRRGSEENRNLMQRVKELQKKNKTLMAHIGKLQSFICASGQSKATPSTCLMIVMLSVFLVSLPNICLNSKEVQNEQEQVTISRSLLSTSQKDDDTLNMEEFILLKDDENVTDSEIAKVLDEIDGKYESVPFDKDTVDDGGIFNSLLNSAKNFFGSNNELSNHINSDYGGFRNKNGFIEPDLDDFDDNIGNGVSSEPPAKKMKLIDDYYHQNDENFVPLNSVVTATTVPANLADAKNK